MDTFHSKKLIRSKAGLRIVWTNEECKSPFVIQEPTWVPDNEISHCTECQTRFGFTTRKHHCRRCGKIFCSCCCKAKIGLQRMCFVDPVRICLKCEPQTKVENLFFERHLKLLLNGAVFKHESKSEKDFYLLSCKLSQDHRFLLFDGVAIPPIEMNQIASIDVKCDTSTGMKNLIVDYVVGEDHKYLKLHLAGGPQVENIGSNWILAIEEAFKLLKNNGDPLPPPNT